MMSLKSRREVLAAVAPRYRKASATERSHILNEFVATTGASLASMPSVCSTIPSAKRLLPRNASDLVSTRLPSSKLSFAVGAPAMASVVNASSPISQNWSAPSNG